MLGTGIHLVFDLLGYLTAVLMLIVCRRFVQLPRNPIPPGYGLFYLVVASIGAAVGSVLLGTANVMLAGMEATLAKSVLGALIGGIVAIEGMKALYGIRGSTGVLLVPGIALGIAIGRIGCFLAGLSDYTYGIPSGGPFAVDFGDGIPRHPVQLYEALALVLFAAVYLAILFTRPARLAPIGFYLFCFAYGAQRFALEFLKPYPDVAAGLNLFQFGCLFLVAYSVISVVLARTPAIRALMNQVANQSASNNAHASERKARPYLFYGQTTSLCETCLETVPAKIIFQNDCVYYLKRCAEHGAQKTLISVDIPYFLRAKEYLKTGRHASSFSNLDQPRVPTRLWLVSGP